MNSDVMAALGEFGIIPVIAIESAADALPLADAMLAGGLGVAEITFRTAAAAEVIHTLSRERPNLLVGAGTVLSVQNLEAARNFGARFGVAPGFNPRVVRRAEELRMPFVPGVCTPTEIEGALELGSKVLKFFPAGAMGGLKNLSAMAAPYLHTGARFVPTGGVTADNLKEYLSSKLVMAVGGTWLATKEDIQQGRWDEIRKRCAAAVKIRDSAR